MKKIFFSIFLAFCLNIFSNVNYNVFVIMDNNAKENVENISKGLKEAGIDSLYSKGYAIHMTLYLTEYKPESLKKIKEVVNKIAKETKPFDVNFYRLRKTGGNWFMLDAENNGIIQGLADEVTVRLNKYRATDAKVPDWAKSIPEKVKSFNLYGSPNVFMNFDPHITLLTPEDPAKIDTFTSKYNFKPFKAKVIGIGIAQVDDLGQAKDIIYSVKFK
jgi:signal peptide